MANEKFEENRGKQILVGAIIISVFTIVVISFLLGWRFIPGWAGESLGTIAGIMSTPFFMEASFAIMGLIIVVGLNVWRRHKDGDEFVLLEENEAPANTRNGVD